jgi:dTDP-4-amino-4,6-dideoxygalactose transaminase
MLARLGGGIVLWGGRGASALCWAYRLAALAFPKPMPEIILPATGCASLASTALACGIVPRFADVDPCTGMPTLDNVKRMYTERTCGVLYAHLFGNTSDIRSLQNWCRECGIALIEDIAQALGAQLPSGEPAGSRGDLVICSFSPTKLIECGGGALIIRSPEIQGLLPRATALLPSPSELSLNMKAALESSYREIQLGLTALLCAGHARNLAAHFLPLQRYYEPLWVEPFPSPTLLGGRLANLPQSLAVRRSKAKIYGSELEGGPWQILDGWIRSGVCWRFTILVNEPGCQAELTKAVRMAGFHASNLYLPLSQLFSEDDVSPNAERFASRVMNLWVDDSVDSDWVRACARSVREKAREVCGS